MKVELRLTNGSEPPEGQELLFPLRILQATLI